jgi:hypothetical protein
VKCHTPLESSQLEFCTKSYVPSKSQGSQFWEFQDFHLGILGQNDIWVPGRKATHREYYKGEDGGFPQVQVMVSLVNL